MQSLSSRIWTRVTVSISYDDNHYTMSTSIGYKRYVKCKQHRPGIWNLVAYYSSYDDKSETRSGNMNKVYFRNNLYAFFMNKVYNFLFILLWI